MNTPFVSVIVPTYNREEDLVTTVRLLLNSEYPRDSWELIIVDQTLKHAPETLKYLLDLEKTTAPVVRWIRPPEVQFASLTKARNLGIANASKAEILLFVDDDVEVKPEFIQSHVSGYENEKVGATVGRVLVPGGPRSAPEGAPVGRITWFGAFINNYEREQSGEAGNLIGCNFSVRKIALLRAGLFDERFMGNALREDSDMAVRILGAGFTIYFVAEALALHNQTASGGTRSQTDRIKWYYALFFNNFLFYHNWAKPWRVPFFVAHMWRPILACAFWYGKGTPSALLTPWRGIRDGIQASGMNKPQ